MSPSESAPPAQAARVTRTPAERTAVRRLEAALLEQARVGDVYARSVGTSAEQSAYVRLRAASLKVSDCERLSKAS
jgi:hypothetical protein